MSASFGFSEANGSGEDVTDSLSNINLGSNDSPNLNVTTYPVTRGNASFEKYIKAKFGSTFTTISNMLFWKSNGDYGAGELIVAAANVSYVQPSATANADSALPTSVGTALAINAAGGGSTISAPGYTAYIRLQLHSTVSTPSGSVAQKTFTFQYDEV